MSPNEFLVVHLLDWSFAFRKMSLWLSQSKERKKFIMGDLRSHYIEFVDGAVMKWEQIKNKVPYP